MATTSSAVERSMVAGKVVTRAMPRLEPIDEPMSLGRGHRRPTLARDGLHDEGLERDVHRRHGDAGREDQREQHRDRPGRAAAQHQQQGDRDCLRGDDPAEPVAEARQAHPVDQRRPQEGDADRQIDELEQADVLQGHAMRAEHQRCPGAEEAEGGTEGRVEAGERHQQPGVPPEPRPPRAAVERDPGRVTLHHLHPYHL